MAEVTLAGKITEVTTRPVSEVTTVTAKAARPTPVAGGVVATQPVNIDYAADTGTIELTLTVGVKTWIYLDGDGWSDSVPVIAAEGMTDLWEAVINGLGLPSDIGDYLGVKDAVNEALESKLAKLTKNHPFDQFYRGVITTGDPAEKYRNTDAVGMWSVTNSTVAQETLEIDHPDAQIGAVIVTPSSAGAKNSVQQVYIDTTTGLVLVRRQNSRGEAGPWTTHSKQFFRGVVTKATIDEITDWTAPEASGAWTVTNSTNAAAMGLPEGVYLGSLFNLTEGNTGAEIRQRIFITTDGDLWTQYATSRGYTDWTKKEPAAAPPGNSNGDGGGGDGGGGGAVTAYDTMLRGRGRIGTGGRPVVAFRFDHSAKPFIEKVLPVLKKHGLPATMPCFIDMMDPQPGYNSDISTGYEWSDVQECFYNGVEIFSHSWSHQDATSAEGIEKEIRESRFALEENMPDVLVHGWANPGVRDAYNGYWGGDSKHHVKMGLNFAGQLITNTYACFNTNKSGVTQQGSRDLAHRTIESITSLDTVKSRVNDAVRISSAAVLMLHPNQLDNAGRMSTDLFEEVCAWIAAERDAGRLEVLTMSGVALADPSTDYRHNLAPALPQWSKSGDTYSVTVPIYFVPFAGGATRQVKVVCSQDTSVSVRVRATGAPMDVSRTVQARAGVPVFVPVGIPRRATGECPILCVRGVGLQVVRESVGVSHG